MNSKLNKAKGYDDSGYLADMASGLIARRFSSVEEAAKAVLDEDGGSNVDRLRRKFREQNWYERGLNAYVEAEIARRATPVSEERDAEGDVTVPGARSIAFMRAAGAAWSCLTSAGAYAFLCVGLAAMVVAHGEGAPPSPELTALAAMVSVVGLYLWVAKAAWKVSPRRAGLHLSFLLALLISVIGYYSIVMPDQDYLSGSALGQFAFAIGVSVIATYATLYVASVAERKGRSKAPEFVALALACTLIGTTGWVPVYYDLAAVGERMKAGVLALSVMDRLTDELKKGGVSVSDLKQAKRQLIQEVVKQPDWRGAGRASQVGRSEGIGGGL